MEQINGPEVAAQPSPLTNDPVDSKWRIRLSALVIIVTGALVYLNSFEGAFLFDDLDWVGSIYVRKLWPPWTAMFSPVTVSRPLVGLSLALNYAISGMNPWSYHAFNLTIHILAALALFGIVRRTLLCESLQKQFGKASIPLAMVIALIWMVHPLQTQSVTYVIQRCESMMGMFYLLTLYSVLRGFYATHKRRWYALAIAACAAGALSKQVIVTAPVMVLVYDVLFHSGSVKEALRKRWGLYVGLVATWSLVVATTIAAPVNKTAGFTIQSLTPLAYLKSQSAVIIHYLRLAVWPDSLCLDYGWKPAETVGEILPFAIALTALIGVTLWALWRRKAIAFLGVWFFLILAPTSSIMPFDDLIFEHRMYLPLAAVVGLVVLSGYRVGKRLLLRLYATEEQRNRIGRLAAMAVVTLLVTSLSLLTLRRNVDYKSLIVMWGDVVEKSPQNARAQNNFGNALFDQGRIEEALLHFTEACKYRPDYANAENNLGRAFIRLGKFEQGKAHLLKALRINPNHQYAHFHMGQLLASQGQFEEAISHFSQVQQGNAFYAQSYAEMGMALERQGKLQEAIEHYDHALQLDANLVDVLSHLALILATRTDPEIRNSDKALQLAERAVRLTQGREAVSLYALAVSYAEAGRFSEALEAGQKAKGVAAETGNQELAAAIETKLKLYREGRARRDNKPEKAN
jgi:protein O-mannosyl-transferase